jgi:hypothetical protein
VGNEPQVDDAANVKTKEGDLSDATTEVPLPPQETNNGKRQDVPPSNETEKAAQGHAAEETPLAPPGEK